LFLPVCWCWYFLCCIY